MELSSLNVIPVQEWFKYIALETMGLISFPVLPVYIDLLELKILKQSTEKATIISGADLDHVTYGLWRTKILTNCSKSFTTVEVLVLILIFIQMWRTRKSFLNPPLNLEMLYFRPLNKTFPAANEIQSDVYIWSNYNMSKSLGSNQGHRFILFIYFPIWYKVQIMIFLMPIQNQHITL